MDYLPADKQPALRLVPYPSDTNTAGDIFGGWIMSHVDIAGSVVACQRAQGRVVTVAVNSFHFKKPVFVGDLVSFYAQVKQVGNTSLTVDVEVFAQRGVKDMDLFGECVKVTEARLTYVAIDIHRNKRVVPPESS